MYIQTESLDVAISATVLATVLLLSIPWAIHLLKLIRSRRRPAIPQLYEDSDGKASEESSKAYSDLVPRLVALACVLLGLASSIGTALLLSHSGDKYATGIASRVASWLDVAIWSLIACQCASLPLRGAYAVKYRLVAAALMEGLVLTLSVGIRHGYNALHDVINRNQQQVQGVAYLTQILAGIGMICALGSIPRRPDVFVNGQLVDQQFTVPLLWRLSHSWNAVVFQISKERQLQLADIPKLGYKTRAETVHHRFLARKAEGRLWWRLIKAHAWEILEQNVLTLIIAGLVIFPEIALYNFLGRIESRQDFTTTDPVLFMWIFALFISIVLEVVLGNLLSWVTSSKLEMPVSSMLQTLVFRKALSQYETTRPPQKEDLEALRNPQAAAEAKDNKKGQKDSKAGKKDKAQGPDVSQSVINHMKLDSNRITMFCTFANSFPSAFFKLILAGTFLIQLIGWKAFFGGLFAAGLMIPVSTYMSGKFRDIQFGLMRYRDGKAHVLEEALQGMRQIKYSALEQLWQDKILKARNEELAQFWKASLLICVLMFIINLGPLLLACVSLSIYAWENSSNIRASVIFTSLGLFQMVDEAVAMLPVLQTFMMEAWTSCTRLEKYLKQADKPQVATPGEVIAMEKATVAWPKAQDLDAKEEEQPDPRSILNDITVEFPSCKLSIITGKTGSGKSLLLAAILGEVKLISGKITFPEAADLPAGTEDEVIPQICWTIPALSAYVSQSPWIEGGTVRENIVFGLPFVQSRYDAAIHACALEKDIETLVEGEDTEVGPKGVQLSGGQRWRLALARALYSRAGIIVMDDVLSAVDAHVGRRIVEEALAGRLAEGRTRILATHHAELCLPYASYLVRLHDLRLESTETLQPSHRPAVDMSEEGTHTSGAEGNGHAQSGNGKSGMDGKNGKTRAGQNKEDTKEKREVGRVKWQMYKIYLSASGGFLLWTLGISILIAVQLASVARTWSLKELAESAPTETVNTSVLSFLHVKEQHAFIPAYDYTAKYEKRSTAFWMSVYVGLYLLSSIISIGRTLSFFAIGLTAAKVLFERMTYAVLRAPLRWIDTVPSGRILNRFTTDTFTLDRRTVEPLSGFLRSIMALIIVIGASLSVSVYVILFGIFLSFFYIYVANRFIVTARELKRINSVSHSPIYDQFSSVLNGLSTIRAYHRTKFYMNRMFGLIDDATKASYALNVCNLWMGFRLGMLGAAFVTFVATAVALLGIDAALAGFSLTFAFGYTSALRALLSALTSLELGFNAVERVTEYASIEVEAQGGRSAPAAWPTDGRIVFENLTVAYAQDLPPVLHGLTFAVNAGERIGIVGRTGAGKSTLASVLFRLLEPREGSVSIDGLDISTLKLEQLRSRLAIIPQDPFLFSGTLRSNLDMQGELDDFELQAALQRVHLIEPAQNDANRPSQYPPKTNGDSTMAEPIGDDSVVTLAPPILETGNGAADLPDPIDPVPETEDLLTLLGETEEASSSTTAAGDSPPTAPTPPPSDLSIFSNLSMPISTGGANLSQGQRQLVCLARALLTRPKIVVLDEATSAVDRATDEVIQKSLREAFVAAGCTVLVIAHRLSTVADFDRLLVLENGKIAEIGTPKELLESGMQEQEKGKGVDRPNTDSGDAPAAGDNNDEVHNGTGAFWELVKKSAEKDKLLDMILAHGSHENA